MSAGDFVHSKITGNDEHTALFNMRVTRGNFELHGRHIPGHTNLPRLINRTHVTIEGSYNSSKPAFLTTTSLHRYPSKSDTAHLKSESNMPMPTFAEPFRQGIDAAMNAWEQSPERPLAMVTHEKLSNPITVICQGADIGWLTVSSQIVHSPEFSYSAPVFSTPRHASQSSTTKHPKCDHHRAYSTFCGISSTADYSTSTLLHDEHHRCQARQRLSVPCVAMNVGYLYSLKRPHLHSGFASLLRSPYSALRRPIAPSNSSGSEIKDFAQRCKYLTTFDIAKDDHPTESKSPKPGCKQHCALLGVGSNVGNRVFTIEDACRALDAEHGTSVKRTSGLWETKAMYVVDQDDFLNGVCEVSTHTFGIRGETRELPKSGFGGWVI